MAEEKDKALSGMPHDILRDYDLDKPHLKELSFDDLNNLSQAVMEHIRKGGKPNPKMCTTMCCP